MSLEETIQIENVVATTSLGQELNLEALNEDLPSAQYRPTNFPGVVYRLQEPKSVTLIFRSGKLVTTGAKDVEKVHQAMEIVIEKLRELGVDADLDPDVSVENIVSSADLEERLNLNAVAIGLGLENVEYEPEQFPGLVYRMKEPDVVTLLFGSGKVIVTGGKDESQAPSAVENVQSRLDNLGIGA